MGWGDFVISGFKTLASSFAISYINIPLLETMGLRRMSLLNIRKPIEFGYTNSSWVHLSIQGITDSSFCLLEQVNQSVLFVGWLDPL